MADPYRCSTSLATEVLPARCVPLEAPSRVCPEVVRKRWATVRRTARLVGVASLVLATASLAPFVSSVAAVKMNERAAAVSRKLQEQLQPRAPAPLAAMGEVTHNADALWERAERFATKRGITLVRASVAVDAPRHPAQTRLFPAQGTVPGLQVFGVAPDTSAALLGLRNGDVLTAVNGFALHGANDASAALRAASYEDVAVIELVREGRPVAIRVGHLRGSSTGRMRGAEPLREGQQHRQTQT